VVVRGRPGGIAFRRRGPVLVQQAGQDRVGRAQVRDGAVGGRAQGCPSTAPGTPVFVEYLGWIFMSGRI
jgi:hypothetical protein